MDWESRFETLRNRVGEDPAGLKRQLRDVLVDDVGVAVSPTARVRLYGLLVACCRDLGELEEGLDTFEVGIRLGGSPAARAELLAQGATLHVERGNVAPARECIDAALELVDSQLAKPVGVHPQTQKRRRGLVNLKAGCLVVRGNIGWEFKDRPKEAFQDAIEAIELTSHSSATDFRIAAVTLLTAMLLRFGTVDDVVQALELLEGADQLLARRRVRRRHLHRVRVRWGKAVALARLGRTDKAEHILSEVIDTLYKMGAEKIAKDAVDTMIWIVGECARQTGRAEYFKRFFVDKEAAHLT